MSEVSAVSEVSVSTIPSPFPTSSVINFSELAKKQLSCPDVPRLEVCPTLRLATVPVQDGSLLLLYGHVAPLAPLYEAPLRSSLKTFQLQVGKRVEVVSVQRLKPAFTADY